MDQLRRTPSEGRQMCLGNIQSMGYVSSIGYMSPPSITNILNNIDELISYTIQDNFCDNDKNLIVDKLETYLADVFVGMCESDDWSVLIDKNVDYLFSKPLMYIK